jgi:hypothetical protein
MECGLHPEYGSTVDVVQIRVQIFTAQKSGLLLLLTIQVPTMAKCLPRPKALQQPFPSLGTNYNCYTGLFDKFVFLIEAP